MYVLYKITVYQLVIFKLNNRVLNVKYNGRDDGKTK